MSDYLRAISMGIERGTPVPTVFAGPGVDVLADDLPAITDSESLLAVAHAIAGFHFSPFLPTFTAVGGTYIGLPLLASPDRYAAVAMVPQAGNAPPVSTVLNWEPSVLDANGLTSLAFARVGIDPPATIGAINSYTPNTSPPAPPQYGSLFMPTKVAGILLSFEGPLAQGIEGFSGLALGTLTNLYVLTVSGVNQAGSRLDRRLLVRIRNCSTVNMFIPFGGVDYTGEAGIDFAAWIAPTILGGSIRSGTGPSITIQPLMARPLVTTNIAAVYGSLVTVSDLASAKLAPSSRQLRSYVQELIDDPSEPEPEEGAASRPIEGDPEVIQPWGGRE